MVNKEYEICKEACEEEGCYIPKDYEFHTVVASTPIFIRAYFMAKGRMEGKN